MRYFTNRDLTLIGIIAAIGQGLGFLLGMPIRATTGIPFLGSWLAGPPRVLLTLLALSRIKKVGVATFIEGIYALAAFLKPGGFSTAFFCPLIAGMLTDICVRMVFQNPDHQLFMPDCLSEVFFPLRYKDGKESREQVERASILLDRLGLIGMEKRHPHSMSLGEKKRLAIASALFHRPLLLLLDEPTTGIDRKIS